MDYRKLPAQSRDYMSGKLLTNSIENVYPTVLNDKRLLAACVSPAADWRKLCRQLWGVPSFYFLNEYEHSCYLIDLGKTELLILAAGGKGTSYEVVTTYDKKKRPVHNKELIAFFEWWGDKLLLTKPIVRKSVSLVKPS